MKKVLATLVLVLIASTVSAAEVKVGAWGRGFFVPYYSDGASDAKTFDAVSWGAGTPRVGFNIDGSSDNVGFHVDINADQNDSLLGDQRKIWVKPVDMVTVSVGTAYDDTLRGNGTFGSFDWLRISWTGEDLTFMRVRTDMQGGNGAIIALDPMKELHAYISFNSLTSSTLMEDAMKDIQIGAGYTIGSIGTVRAQYVGLFNPEVANTAAAGEPSNAVAESDASYINAAFKLTVVPNMLADFGIFFPTTADDAGYDMKVAAYVKYTMGAIGIHALTNIQMGILDTEAKDATGIEAGVGLDYAIGNGLGAVVDFRYLNEAAAGIKDGNIGGMFGVEKGFSNGKIGAGVEFATAAFASQPEVDFEDKIAKEEMSIAIPVKVEYWF